MIKKLGNVNTCGTATLYDKSGRPILTCNDTPNAIAVAFRENNKAVSVKDSYYQPPTLDWGKPGHLREHYEDRFNSDLTPARANITEV